MFQQDLAPLGSLTLSALVALLPLATIFVLLGWLRVKAHWAALASVAVAIVVAVAAYRCPVGLALLSATEGAVFGLFPIMWIVFTAIWLYQLTVVSGRSTTCARRSATSPTTRAARPSSSRSASAA